MRERPRRNRHHAFIREAVAEGHLRKSHLIMPLFLVDKESERLEIESMPGQFRLGKKELKEKILRLSELGIGQVALFPAVEESLKNKRGTYGTSKENFYLEAIQAVKLANPDMQVMTDVALDPYSSDGHDGVVSESGEILNDETLDILCQMSVLQAQAGADLIGPSDMMDGRVGRIRDALDLAGYSGTGIISYTAKYASSFYGPFRDALDSAPKAGDKKTYQMDYRNSREALREARLDANEGADILMVKPGISYLDIIYRLKENSDLPIACYQVSGEYAMIKAAAERGWLDGKETALESLYSMRRAGADIILSYFAEELAVDLSS